MERTAICNAALALIGEARIPDFDAPGPTAQACRDAWDICRQGAIRSYHWNFALHRVALSASATAPHHGYSYAFPLPTDYLKAIQVNGLSAGTSYAEFSIENGQVLTNDSTVNLFYVRDVEECSRWDSAFVEFFIFKLGAAVAPRITTSQSIAESLEARAMGMLAKAKEGDADESIPHVIRGPSTSNYLLARGGMPVTAGASSSSSSSSSTGSPTTITLSGDATGSGTSSITVTISNNAVTNAKLADMAASRIKARVTGTTGDPEDATLSQVLDLVGSAANGDILMRSGGVWTRLGIGTSGQALLVSGGLPSWGTVSGSGTGDLLAANNLSELSATASTARANLGLTIGTHVQAYSATLAQVAAGTWTGAASITTLGTIGTGTWQGTAVAVLYGGTGATTASGARTNLGLVIGTDVQAYNASLAAISAATWTGAASITTLGTITTGTWSATTIAVDKGGTGRTSHTAYAVLCGGTTSTGAQQSIASVGTAGQVLKSAGAGALPAFADDFFTVGATFDGGGSAVSTGKLKGFAVAMQAGTIAGWNVTIDTGTLTFKAWKIATGTAKPTSANSINTSGVAISTGTHVASTTLTDFTSTTVAAGDVFAFELTAVSGATEGTVQLKIKKS